MRIFGELIGLNFWTVQTYYIGECQGNIVVLGGYGWCV